MRVRQQAIYLTLVLRPGASRAVYERELSPRRIDGRGPVHAAHYGGGPTRFYLHIAPLTVPQIATTANGPAAGHSRDFSLVAPSDPTAASEARPNGSMFTGARPKA